MRFALSSSIFRVRHLSRDSDDDAQFHEGGVSLRRELGQKAQDRTLLSKPGESNPHKVDPFYPLFPPYCTLYIFLQRIEYHFNYLPIISYPAMIIQPYATPNL